jgi:hypothetical protein
MPQPPDDLARELRSAVLASDYEEATRCTLQYSAALGQYWTGLSAEQRSTSHLPKQSLELLEWVRKMTLLQTALTGERLSAVEKASRTLTARSMYLRLAALAAQG